VTSCVNSCRIIVFCTMCRKRTALVSQVFTLLGAGCSCACVAATSPELLMVGRVLVGINSGQFSLNFNHFYPLRAHSVATERTTSLCRVYTRTQCRPDTCIPDEQLVYGYIYVNGYISTDTSCSSGILVDCISAT